MGTASLLAAAPSIGRALLRLNSAGLQWSLTAATLTGATFLMLGALLADRVGRRPMVIVGLVEIHALFVGVWRHDECLILVTLAALVVAGLDRLRRRSRRSRRVQTV